MSVIYRYLYYHKKCLVKLKTIKETLQIITEGEKNINRFKVYRLKFYLGTLNPKIKRQ